MPSKITKDIALAQFGDIGEYKYPWIESSIMAAAFTKIMYICYVDNLTLTKIKGGGNYTCNETYDEYRISS